jgi:hypothetical protein
LIFYLNLALNTHNVVIPVITTINYVLYSGLIKFNIAASIMCDWKAYRTGIMLKTIKTIKPKRPVKESVSV